MADSMITGTRAYQWLSRQLQSLKEIIVRLWRGKSVFSTENTRPTQGMRKESAHDAKSLAKRSVHNNRSFAYEFATANNAMSTATRSDMVRCREAINHALIRYDALKPRLDSAAPARDPIARDNKARALICAATTHLAKTSPDFLASDEGKAALDLMIMDIGRCDAREESSNLPKKQRQQDISILSYSPPDKAYQLYKELQDREALYRDISNGDMPCFEYLMADMGKAGFKDSSFQVLLEMAQQDQVLRQRLQALEDFPQSCPKPWSVHLPNIWVR